MTKYSVVIPVFNRAHLVSKAIDSVLQQTFMDYEVIVCDDGSTDDTERVLDQYGVRIRRVRSNRLGPGGARNAAIAEARGRYVACLDSDDVWMPWALECVDQAIAAAAQDCLVYMQPHPQAEVCDTNAAARSPLSIRHYADLLSAPLTSPHGSGMIGAIPRQLIVDIGGFDSSLVVAEDHDLALRLGVGVPYVVIESPRTLLCSARDDGISRNRPAIYVASYSRIIEKEAHHLYPGGVSRRRARRMRIGMMVSIHALKSVESCEYKQALALYRRSVRLMLSICRWRFVMFFPLLTFLHLILNPTNLFPIGRRLT